MPIVSVAPDYVKTLDVGGVIMSYTDRVDGAGSLMYRDFTNTVRDHFPDRTFDRCLEWCSGPGFIGYSLLASRVVSNLTLSDIYSPALELADTTRRVNNLDTVDIINSYNWVNIPPTRQWDLIVANPPHFSGPNYWNEQWTYEQRIYIDTDWSIHQNFFGGASQYLANNGYIVLIENAWGSGVATFNHMIDLSGLRIVKHFFSKLHTNLLGQPLYYLIITHK